MKFDDKIKELCEAKVDVQIDRYKFSNGNKSPKGQGRWIFEIGDEEISFGNLPYSKAKNAAMKMAKEKNIYTIELLP